MALGVVPMIVDYAGPGELVSSRTGYKVPIGPRFDIIRTFKATLEDVVNNPSALPELGANASDRVARLFTWEAKARQIADVYDWVLDNKATKPSFFED